MHTFAMTAALRLVLIARRELAEMSLRQLAREAGTPGAYSRLSRYETHGRCGNLDEIVTTYATGLGITQPDIWREALDLAESDPRGKRATIALAGRRAAHRR